MGRKSLTSGVQSKGRNRIQFDFEFEGVRYRPTIERIPSEGNLRRAAKQLEGIKARIAHSTFNFAEEFPDYRGLPEGRRHDGRAHVQRRVRRLPPALRVSAGARSGPHA